MRSSRSFDVYSLNAYNIATDPKVLGKVYQISGRPILIGEFHFGVPGRGLGAGLVQTRDQQERGVAYRYYVEQAAAFPALIGTGWFQWVDQPSPGRMDGENYNIGLVDVTDRPYRSLWMPSKRLTDDCLKCTPASCRHGARWHKRTDPMGGSLTLFTRSRLRPVPGAMPPDRPDWRHARRARVQT